MDFMVVDLETTGLDCDADKIIEIGAVKISDGLITGEYSSLINPGKDIPEEITLLTGITTEMVKEEPELSEIIPGLKTFLGNNDIVAHNAGFDRSFLQPHLEYNHNWIDTMELAKIFMPTEPSYALQNLIQSLNIDCPQAHRALSDARAAAQLFIKLIGVLDETDTYILEILAGLCGDLKEGTPGLIRDALSRRIKTFSQDKINSRSLFTQGLENNQGIFTQNHAVQKNPVFCLSSGEIRYLLQPQGPFHAKSPSYEYRPQQLDMAEAVADSFNIQRHLIVEAGTGTGKSLAYLLPSIIWSIKSGNKVIVSTHTLNLQEQLLTKDIPLAKEILGMEFDAAVVKGRGHYFCLRKWEYWLEQKNTDVKRFMMRLVLWLNHTQTGDCNEMSFSRQERSNWHLLSAQGDTCYGIKCRYFRGLCYVARAKKRAESAHVLIANHSLILANATMDDNILPEYKYLIIDEAHHLEKVAEEQFGAEISYPQLASILTRIKKTENSGLTGALDSLLAKTGKLANYDEEKARIQNKIKIAAEAVSECQRSAREFFSVVGNAFIGETAQGTGNTRTVRILPVHRCSAGWDAVTTAGDNLVYLHQDLITKLLQLGEELSFLEAESGVEYSGSREISLLAASLKEKITVLDIFFKDNDDNYVSWIEFTAQMTFPILHTAPVEVKDLLNRYLFSAKSSVVLTSATLTVNGEFNFYIDSIGINMGEIPVKTMLLESPFSYNEHVLMGAVSDLPDPSKTADMVFTEAVSDALIELICASQGRALVLFTSHNQLRRVYERIRFPLSRFGITVLAHGISGSRAKLLEQFKNNPSSVILGANSFWEGVDVVGDALSSVIIVKLPFWPPALPTVAARLDRLKSLRLDGFSQYSLPQAIIRFKQGFGRLIRSTADHGVFVILDKRIYEKRYGEIFIRSLPGIRMLIKNTKEMAKAINGRLN